MRPGNPLEQLKKLANQANLTEKLEVGSLIKLDHEEESQPVTLEQAERIMGEKNFLGPRDIENCFGFMVREVPPIPFSQQELEMAKNQDQELILFVSSYFVGQTHIPLTSNQMIKIINNKTSTGKNLSFSNTIFGEAAHEQPRAGWRLVSKSIIPDTKGASYVLQNIHLFAELVRSIPKEKYEKQLSELLFDTKSVQKLILEIDTADPYYLGEVSKILINSKVTKTLRPRLAETIYQLAVHEQKTKERLVGEAVFTTSGTFNEDRYNYSIGDFDNGGFICNECLVTTESNDQGALFSRGALE